MREVSTRGRRDGDESAGYLYLLVFVVGTGSLGAEIAVVRLIAPYFGASTVVWANTIGIVLIALSLGYWLGGRFADRHPTRRPLCLVTLAAAALLAAIPFAARPLLDAGVMALDDISAGAFLGSLAAVLVLVAVPVLLLGAISPWALRLAVRDVEQAGTVAGRLYALSTAGSLVGTLVAALVLIPFAGTRRTFLLIALLIAVVAIAGLRPRLRLAVLPVAIALLLLPAAGARAPDRGSRILYETETPYQYARVLERGDGSRVLELNEGHAFHSIYRPETVLTGDVWDEHLVLPFAARTSPPRRVAVLGNAAGTTARAYGALFPATRVDGVEIDGELAGIGRHWFGMTNPNLRVYSEDARPFLRHTRARYDVISVDAYRQPYIPFYLATREFFEQARDRLAPGGVLVVNVAHPPGEKELEKVLSATIASTFPHVVRDSAQPTNTLVAASESPLGTNRLLGVAGSLPRALRPLARATAVRLAPALAGGRVLTDDKAPVEWLIERSIVDYAGGG